MATTIRKSREMIGLESIEFIRPQTIRIDIFDARPNTRLFPFFDGVRVDEYMHSVQETPEVEVSLPYSDTGIYIIPPPIIDDIYPLITTSKGRLTVFFNIPSGKFNTGDREILFSDTETLSDLDIPGNVYGSVRGIFKANGSITTYQNTTFRTTITIVEIPIPLDPLAQSFFTWGRTGGVVLTSLDLYFQSKDVSVPVSVEIRPLINGFPGPLAPSSSDMVVFKSASDILISNDASIPTNFRFNAPIYLPEDGEFCFVVRSNCTSYNIWTSKMGERSIEEGTIIHEQPYVGSLFKSENNITWTPEQFEDIKFSLFCAEFDTSGSVDIDFKGNSPARAIQGSSFTTKTGSNLIIVKMPHFHGLAPGSVIDIATDVGASYNGIPSDQLTGSFPITRKIDDYYIEFSAGANATSSGPINSCNIVRHIAILNGGSGYTSAPSVVIGSPISGVTATATAVTVDGRVVAINITNPGSGYTSDPSITITGVGSGASAVAINEAIMTVVHNTPYNIVSPQFKHFLPDGTKVNASVNSCSDTYGILPVADMRIERFLNLDETRLVASKNNELNSLSGNSSFNINIVLSSSNKNVSPMIDVRERPGAQVFTHAINNQARTESVDTLTTSATAVVAGYTITNAGVGYSTTPTVTVVPAENDRNKSNIVNATITATIGGGSVTSLTITSPGTGYTVAPLIVIDAPSSGTTATATTNISAFNSELMTSGTSYSRYLTKKNKLASVSSGIRVFALAQSTPWTTFDWYIRTSLSSDATKHTDGQWRLLKCDVPRDRSANAGQFFEYEFYIDNIPAFDTYDMKMVPCSSNPSRIPYIKRYRAIVVV